MASIQVGGPITALRGSIGGVTYQSNRSTPLARSRATGTRRMTSRQASVITKAAGLTVTWRTLSFPDQEKWLLFANAHHRVNKYGQERVLSGYQWFLTINAALALTGTPAVIAPPDYLFPDVPQSVNLIAFASLLQIEYAFQSLQPTTRMVIYTTPPRVSVGLSPRSLFRLTKVFTPQESAVLNIVAEWVSVHKMPFPPTFPANFQLAALVYTVHSVTGLTTLPFIPRTKWTYF